MKKLKTTLPLALIMSFILMGSCSIQRFQGPAMANFDGERFINTEPTPDKGFFDVLKFLFSEKGDWPDSIQTIKTVPVERIHDDNIEITFINHSTVLIQTGGLNILTDPIYAERASPVSFAGPGRNAAPGVSFQALPPIDVVLISHDHYDHLDIETLNRLAERDKPLFFVGLGVSDHFDEDDAVLPLSKEMNWWDTHPINDQTEIHFVPVRHFSGRGVNDTRATLWGGFVVSHKGENIYFGGDTGYGNHFLETRERFGRFKLALLPIGAYKPQWFLQKVHMNPEEAVRAHLDLNAEKSIAIHYGTFRMANEGLCETYDDLEKGRQKYAVSSDAFITLLNGETLSLPARKEMEPALANQPNDL